ncbi:g12834 [Coccomyxa viridis]|uniref:G12834 protein n=1 Tax=Coccomyxa viridis TaxID=1274662 RepID=A0ABP1GIF5_9CHLO
MTQRGEGNQKLPGTGPGPMLGGSAGGQDYSLSSMLERAPYKTKEDHVGGMPELNSKLSAGEQDLLAGSGTVEGEDGQKPPFNIRMSGLMPQNSGEETGKADQTAARETAARETAAPSLGDPKLSAGEHDLLAGSGLVEGAAGRKPAFNMKMSGFPEDDAIAGGAKAGAPTGQPPDQPSGGLQDKTPQDTSSFSKDEKKLLRGQGLMSLQSGPAPPTSSATDKALDKEGERDELKEEQTEVPASEFDKQPSSLDSMKQAVAAGTETIANVASQATEKVKEMTIGGNKKG